MKHSHFEVDLCENGLEALRRLEGAKYGVLVLSLVLQDPIGDAEILRKLRETEDPPCVVVLSAGSRKTLDRIASDLIAARLSKPFHIDELVGAVKKCFDH
ncbi:MAG: response regulator [Gemmatimonadota bacterium]|nr:response regulator [Gemmatimonadota bacterium]